ncbi:MAG TPA: hypothetical protein VHK90_15840, partial [Thermoanaerobaculia bacterium]|nr:hypothetical protein [Thermoanaerobaculia bacterium]
MQRRWMQCAAAVLLLSCAFAATAATFTVTSSDDSGPGTLRQAILDANATPGRDQIVFQSHSGPTSPLPSITDAVDIDGTLNDFTAQISGFATSAFRFSAGSSTSTLRNVRVSNFSESVRIESGVSGVTITRGDFDNSFLVFGNDNVIGALAAGEGNRIEFLSVIGQSNDFFGNRIVDVQITGASNVLQGNTTGYIRILGGDDSRVGPGNATGPISLEFSSGSIVEGNTVSSSDIYGIFVRDSSVPANIRIASNTINGGTAGVVVTTLLAPTAGVEITRNAIRNVTIPIDLGNDGSTPNDPAPDADAGPNNLQNFPLLTSATLQAGTLEVQGSLTSAPLTSYRIEIFSSPAADPGAHTFLDSFTVSTDATGNVAFTQTISASPSPDDVVTSTATSLLTNDTSEVSAPVAIAAPGALGFATATQSVDENAGTVTIVVTR